MSHADKDHIHHRLLDMGHSHRQAVLLMYLWSLLIAGCALAVAFINGRAVVAVVVSALLLVFGVTFVPRVFLSERRERASTAARIGADEVPEDVDEEAEGTTHEREPT